MMLSLLFGIIALVAFVTGTLAASPDLRAFADATIGSADIIDESIQSVDIKNGQVKASDIATYAVTADEIKGVTKLLFGQCVLDSTQGNAVVLGGSTEPVHCTINGVDSDDSAIATLSSGSPCIDVAQTFILTNDVQVDLRNNCTGTAMVGSGNISVIAYDK